ncbi:unnamed protein product [Rotaria sp. Silwood2]|nr:unnamed protein product [Rotaria sp. Silwood2]CAF4116616.1 unnamed protein product [Rotaria sp. Silwood2]
MLIHDFLGGHFEGDIVIPRMPRGVVKAGDDVRWPNGIVPYTISSDYSFYHEQSRPDRDDYVKVIWENIIPGYTNFFSLQLLFKSN